MRGKRIVVRETEEPQVEPEPEPVQVRVEDVKCEACCTEDSNPLNLPVCKCGHNQNSHTYKSGCIGNGNRCMCQKNWNDFLPDCTRCNHPRVMHSDYGDYPCKETASGVCGCPKYTSDPNHASGNDVCADNGCAHARALHTRGKLGGGCVNCTCVLFVKRLSPHSTYPYLCQGFDGGSGSMQSWCTSPATYQVVFASHDDPVRLCDRHAKSTPQDWVNGTVAGTSQDLTLEVKADGTRIYTNNGTEPVVIPLSASDGTSYTNHTLNPGDTLNVAVAQISTSNV